MPKWWLSVPLFLALHSGHADIRNSTCDHSRPETYTARDCSLCAATDKQPPEPAYYILKDSNPNKPNRWLLLPRFHDRGPQDLTTLTAEQRTAYWTFGVAKAKELWGDGWGMAINSIERRTQCHLHAHIGRLRQEGVEESMPHRLVVDSPAAIPIERPGDGILIHPTADGKFHVHYGNDSPELQLDR
jgi:CDP-diacylglycerol pyrophosphatase